VAEAVICIDCENEIEFEDGWRDTFCCPECGAEPLCEACYMRRHLHHD